MMAKPTLTRAAIALAALATLSAVPLASTGSLEARQAAPTPTGTPAAVRAAAPETPHTPQEVAYRIEAVLDEAADVLRGRARMRYTNHSAETLDSLYFHLYLNAFRPNSAWARRELEFGERRFQDLGPEEWGFQRLERVSVDGEPVTPRYPGAPDSTVVAIPLPAPLAPGESIVVDMDWDARPSSPPRRQGRQGRHYDFAHGFPIVAVHDTAGWAVRPLLPQGEFYGEFMDFDVTLDVAADQVIGATGVPVEGDPGWAARAAPGHEDRIAYRRDVYGAVPPAEPLGLLEQAAAAPGAAGAADRRAAADAAGSREPAPGRRQVRWLARDVHNFAWSAAPDFIYEGGSWGDVAVHVLYKPGDDDWAGGQALERTQIALAWLDSIFGPFAWPQITNLHRIEPGGTEFPMVVMNGSASQGLILHEVAHNYAMGILANNEWKEGFLDEGLVSFLVNGYWEANGRPEIWDRDMAALEQWERAGRSQPITLPSAEFRDFQTYGVMTYTKPAIVFRMLRDYLGEDVFIAGLRRYYADNRLTHVTLADFQRAMEAASGEELDWFFEQWFRTTATLDYAVTEATTRQDDDGRWTTRVSVERRGEAWMPVVLEVGGARVRLESRERVQTVEVRTDERPEAAVVDPERMLLDVDRRNNRRAVREG